MSPIIQVCHARLVAPDIPAAAAFARDIVGLQPVAGKDGESGFRSDQRAQTLCWTAADPRGDALGVELADDDALRQAADTLARHGFTATQGSPDDCARRKVRGLVLAQDGSGNAIDLVVGPAQSGRRYFPARDAGITSFRGAGLRTRALERDLLFWTACLGAGIRDRVGDIHYLAIDDTHHRIALYPSKAAGILELAYEVENFDCLMQNHYFLAERQIKLLFGPGRETASGQAFVRFEAPGGRVFSYVQGITSANRSTRVPRQFRLEAASLCAWGSTARDIPELATPNET